MTTKHLIDGAMQRAKARNHSQFAALTGLDIATVSRMARGKSGSMRIETFDRIQRATGVPVDTLFTWYRLPAGEVLGRVQEAA